MIDFGLSEDQEALQRAAREFLAAECPPALARANAVDGDGIPRALYKKMAELGWMGLAVPEKLGGLGLATLDLVLVLEEIGRAVVPGPFLPTQLVIAALLKAGTAEQRAHWLPRFLAADAFGTFALAEGDQAVEPAGVQVSAKKTKAGWVLNGTKLFVQDAPGADVLLVAARTKAGNKEAGVSLFLVERGTKGLRVRPQDGFDLTRRIGEVTLKNAFVPKSALVGPEGKAWPIVARLIDLACIGIAADSLGGAWRTIEMAVEYAKMREQFGRKIGSFQALKHIAAEMVADVEPSRSLLWYAAYAYDARPAKESSCAAAMAKAALGDIYSRTARRAVEMHGGIGFTWEFDLHLWFKRAHVNEVAYGDPVFHRERVAALEGF
ncbi:MAG TPA: acyl-CoA dehydrogenase family protein [Candidatus Eisenbacteria bacterium]|nr:acyl-CoA dehydrogenase family protein [Candidatus Eisenbacteria bacterium]